MIGKTIAHYKITKLIGEGSMGEVYLAEDTELQRRVALKFLPASAAGDAATLDRFKREARAAAALNHPNIITIHEIGHYEGRPYIAMSYIDGDSLRDEIEAGMEIERALSVIIQACEGLHKAHGAGIIHRDIKPDNIISDSEGRVKILDFGIATFIEPGSHDPLASTAGTAYYMSPEQARGEAVDARSDIFSLGAILYEMLGGKRPFEGEHISAIHYAIWNTDPAPLSGLNPAVDPELERIVTKALEKNPDNRYQSAAELAEDLRAAQTKTVSARGGLARRAAIPAIVALIALAVVFIMNPFKNRSANADENILAVMYFENLAQEGDPDRLGEIITDLLITNFSQSENLKVVSSQRLYDLLKLQGKEGTKVIDRSTATAVARAAGARWMMLGSILQVSPSLIVSTQLIDVASGTIEGSQRLTGTPGESVFTLVDRMTGSTREDLDIPTPLDVTHPRPVADVTTNSLEAYRYYVTGMEFQRKVYMAEALENFRKAIEIDSTFAMAHYHYGTSLIGAGNIPAGLEALKRATRYSDRVTEKERLYIEAITATVERRFDEGVEKLTEIIRRYPQEKEAYFTLASLHYGVGDNEQAIDELHQVLELDSLYKTAYNMLAYLYDRQGDFDKSIEAINRYIQLSPGEANPLDSRADLYAYNGDLDGAIDSYKKALEIKPDFTPSRRKLGDMYLFKGMYDEAAEQYRELAASAEPADRSTGRLCSAIMELYQGKLHKALEALETGLAADEMEGFTADSYLSKYSLRASIYVELRQFGHAGEVGRTIFPMIKQAIPMLAIPIDLSIATAMAYAGNIEGADSIVAMYAPEAETFDKGTLSALCAARGMIALRSNDPGKAIEHFERADSLTPRQFELRYWLAYSHLDANHVSDAIAILKGSLNRYDQTRLGNPIDAVKAVYLLGKAYERAGQTDEAVSHYRKFLNIWKDADPELEEVADARRRLKKLNAGS